MTAARTRTVPLLLLLMLAVLSEPVPGTAQDAWDLSDDPVTRLGTVEGDEAQQFGAITSAFLLDQGDLLVIDEKFLDVRLFSRDGTLRSRTGQAGDGPGEFRTIMSAHQCMGDTTYVYDPALARLSRFTPSGEFAGTLPVSDAADRGPPPRDFSCNSDGTLAWILRNPRKPEMGPHRSPVTISLESPRGNTVDLGPFPGPERYFNGHNDFPRPMGRLTTAAVGPQAVYVGTGNYGPNGRMLEIFVYSPSGHLRDTIRDRVSRREITSGHITTFIESKTRGMSGEEGEKLRRFYRSLEYPEYFPAYDELLVDSKGQLWVQEFPIPGDETGTWRVYTPDGNRIATVNVPVDFQLTLVTDQHVVGVRDNDLGVPFVEVYDLQTGGEPRPPR